MKYLPVFLLILLTPLLANAQEIIVEDAPPTAAPMAAPVDDAYSPYKAGAANAGALGAAPAPLYDTSAPVPSLVPEVPAGAEIVDPNAPADGTAPAEKQVTEPEPLETPKIEGKKAVLQVLDKINASVEEITVKLEKEKTFKELKIEVKRCIHSPTESKEENLAFMRIWDVGQGDYTNIVFSGWMFSSNPALHSFEHPIYDIVLLECLD